MRTNDKRLWIIWSILLICMIGISIYINIKVKTPTGAETSIEDNQINESLSQDNVIISQEDYDKYIEYKYTDERHKQHIECEMSQEYTIKEYEQRAEYLNTIIESANKLNIDNECSIYDIIQIYDDTINDIDEYKSRIWWTDDELDMLAAVIYYEAGSSDCTDRHQQLVGQVVLNRVHSNEFPNTIYDVITQTRPSVQYSTYGLVLRDMGKNIIPQRCYDNALAVLNGEVDCPDDVVWQAGFRQGSDIYESHKTSYSTTYFCHR